MRPENELSEIAIKIYNEVMLLCEKEKFEPGEGLYVLGILASELFAFSCTSLPKEEMIGKHIDLYLQVVKDAILKKHQVFKSEKLNNNKNEI